MYNLLCDPLPHSVEVEGVSYPIHTGFRNWIRFELLMLDGLTGEAEKAAQLLGLCYVRAVPPTLEQAARAMTEFYMGGRRRSREAGAKQSGEAAAAKKPIYSFQHDAPYIYAAFLTQYGIDLTAADLHWWQFQALFDALGEENMIVKIMEYRSADLGRIKDKHQKAFYRRMKAAYALPDTRSEEEKERQIAQAMASLF